MECHLPLAPTENLADISSTPKPTDIFWPAGPVKNFAGVPGPASLPPDQAVAAINRYIDTVNPLGRDFTDPDGKDDDYQQLTTGPTLYLPVNRPVEIDVQSKDVIHDLFMPTYPRADLCRP